MALTQTEIDYFVEKIMQGKINLEGLVQEVKAKGVPDEELKPTLNAINIDLKKRLAKEKISIEKEEENFKAGLVFIFMVSFGGVIFGVASLLGHLIVIGLIGLICYFTQKQNFIPTLIAGVVFYLSLLVVHPMYFEGRTRFINLEYIIVAGICAIPAYLAYFLATKFITKNAN